MRHVRLERRRWNEDLLERKGKPSLGLKVQRSHCRDRFVLDLATFVEGGLRPSREGNRKDSGVSRRNGGRREEETGFEVKLGSFEGQVLACWYSCDKSLV